MKGITQSNRFLEEIEADYVIRGYKIYNVCGVYISDSSLPDSRTHFYHTRYYDVEKRQHKSFNLVSTDELKKHSDSWEVIKHLLDKKCDGSYEICALDENGEFYNDKDLITHIFETN